MLRQGRGAPGDGCAVADMRAVAGFPPVPVDGFFRQRDTAPERPLRFFLRLPRARIAFEGKLIARRYQAACPGAQLCVVGVDDRVGLLVQKASRPQRMIEIMPRSLQCRRQAPVQQERSIEVHRGRFLRAGPGLPSRLRVSQGR